MGGGLAMVAALGFLIPVLWIYLQFRSLDAVARAYAEAGFSLDFEDYRPAPVAEEDNALTHYQRAGLHFEGLDWESACGCLDLLFTEAETLSPESTAKVWEAVDTFLRDAEPGFAHIAQAEQAPASTIFPEQPYVFGVGWLASTRSYGIVAEAQYIRGRASALRGDAATMVDAVESLLAMAERPEGHAQSFLLSRLASNELSALTLLAWTLPLATLAASDFERLEPLLDRRVARRSVSTEMLAFNVAETHSFLTASPFRHALVYARDSLSGAMGNYTGAHPAMFTPGRLRLEYMRHLDLLLCLQHVGEEGHDACAETGILEPGFESLWNLDSTWWFIETVENMRATRARLARVAVALHRHRAETGEWPAHLGDLRFPLPPDATRDVYRDADLVYRREGEQFTLYSVGRDGVDDGGRDRRDERWIGGFTDFLERECRTEVDAGTYGLLSEE